MNSLRHAWLARRLIEMCGGVRAAAEACRLNKSRLSECQAPGSGVYLPIDVVADLEAYCGEPVYSRELVAARPSRPDGAAPAEEACALTEASAEVQALVRRLSSRHLGMADRNTVRRDLDVVEAHVRALRAEMDAETVL